MLSLAARLLFGGISDIARTPGASRPAVPLHLGMLGRLAMTVTFLGCALPVNLTQTTKGHTRPLHRPPRTVALDHRSLNPTHHITSSSSTWWNQYLKKTLHGFWGTKKNWANTTMSMWLSMKNRRKTPQPFEGQTAPLAMPRTLVPCCLARSCLLRWCLARHCHDKRWGFGFGNQLESLNYHHSKL